MQCAALRHGITAGDIKTEMQCTLLNIRQCADFQPDIRYPRNAVLFSLFADNVRRTEGFTKLAPSAVVIIGYGIAFYFGYTDLMVDGAPLPHQPDTIIRWLIDRLRS